MTNKKNFVPSSLSEENLNNVILFLQEILHNLNSPIGNQDLEALTRGLKKALVKVMDISKKSLEKQINRIVQEDGEIRASNEGPEETSSSKPVTSAVWKSEKDRLDWVTVNIDDLVKRVSYLEDVINSAHLTSNSTKGIPKRK